MMNKFLTTVCCISLAVGSATAQWSKVNDPLLGSGFGVSATFTDNTTLWAGTTGRIFKSSDGGDNWTEVSTGLQSGISGCTGITKLGSRYYCSFSGNGNYFVYYTENAGQNWVLDTVGWSNNFGALPAAIQLTTHKDYVLARLESNFIMYKKNTDSQWNILDVPTAFRTPGGMYSVGDTLVLGAGNVALSTDMGLNWTTRNTTYPQGMPLGFMNRIYQDHANPSVIFGNYQVLATSKPVLFVSKDNQTTWDSIHMDLDNQTLVTAMFIDGQDVYAAYAGSFQAGDTLKKVFHSNDGGNSWTNITENLYSFTTFKFHSMITMDRINGTLFGGFSSAGMVKHTADGGSTGFETFNQTKQLSVYPNPATSMIEVDNSIESLTLFDITGKSVLTTIVTGPIDISALKPGIYFVNAKNGTQHYCSKLVKE
jgi:photosystem II stability/assembly factor-like uncharacterized protein